MPIITFEDKPYDCHQGETILACLTRHGVSVPSSCQSGACQTCLSKALQGQPTLVSQQGLKDTLVLQNYFLPCVCKPEEDMEVAVADQVQDQFVATVIEKTLLNASVLRLRLECENAFEYVAGQFIHIQHPTIELARSYSLASLPYEKTLELHIKHVPDGQMSGYLHKHALVGEQLCCTGPVGNCFYTEKDLEQPLLMLAVGTGLAPLYGILRDALKRGHRGNIHIFHASLAIQGLYYIDKLNALAHQYEQVHYMPCVLHGDIPAGGAQGDIQQIIQDSMKDLAGWRVYICGDPSIVNALKQTCFMAGATMADIYSDPFEFSQP